jgi:hypothetical protein
MLQPELPPSVRGNEHAATVDPAIEIATQLRCASVFPPFYRVIQIRDGNPNQ